MSFHSPHLLWLLVPLVLLFSWELARHVRQAATDWPKIARAWAGAFEVSLGARHTTAETRPRIWLWFGLALCIVALARPQWGVIEEQVFDQSREVIIAVDLSRSMLAQDVKPSRLDRSRLLIQSLLDSLKGERVGLVLFAGTAFLQSPLSADYEVLREFLPALSPDYLPEGGSNYKAMLETSMQAFGTSTADRYLIVLSDGESTVEDWKGLTATLKTKGVRVIGLGVGTTQGSFIPDAGGGLVKDERGAVVMSRLNSSTLQELAQATGGAYTDASSWVDLPGLLSSTVEAGKKGEFSEKNTARLIERFQWFLAPGLLLLLISFWAEFPVRPRERALPLAGRGMRKAGRGTPKVATVASFTIGFLGLSALGTPPSAHAAESKPEKSTIVREAVDHPPSPAPSQEQQVDTLFTAPLRAKIIELVTKENITAKDFASFAETTIVYGKRLLSTQLGVPEKPVTDAIKAVDEGEKLDAKAADWPKLRRELEELLKRDEQKQDQQRQDQKQDQQKQDQQQQDKSSQSDQQKQDDQQKSPEQQKDEQSKSGEQKQQPNEQSRQQDQQNRDAFGDMKDQEEPKPQTPAPKPQTPPPRPGTQKVGGQKEEKSPEQVDPELAMPLQKLDQVRNQDSPAKLQQLMQGQQGKPKPPGKDW